MISLFDMGSIHAGYEDKWEDTLKLGSEHVRRLCIKKKQFEDRKDEHGEFMNANLSMASKSKRQKITMLDKFEVACLIGTNKIKYTTIKKPVGSDDYNFSKPEFRKVMS